MEVTYEIKDYSYRKMFDYHFKEKKFKCIRFFFYCTVCLNVTSLSCTSEEGTNLLEIIYWNMIVKKEVWSSISFVCLVITSCPYSEIKDVIQAIFSFFGLVTATSWFLEVKI